MHSLSQLLELQELYNVHSCISRSWFTYQFFL
jgi:hypothetical protein